MIRFYNITLDKSFSEKILHEYRNMCFLSNEYLSTHEKFKTIHDFNYIEKKNYNSYHNYAANDHFIFWLNNFNHAIFIERYNRIFIKRTIKTTPFIKNLIKAVLKNKDIFLVNNRKIYKLSKGKPLKELFFHISELNPYKNKFYNNTKMEINDIYVENNRVYILISNILIIKSISYNIIEEILCFNNDLNRVFLLGGIIFVNKSCGIFKIDYINQEYINTKLIYIDFYTIIDIMVYNSSIFITGSNRIVQINIEGEVNSIEICPIIKSITTVFDNGLIIYDGASGYIIINFEFFETLKVEHWNYTNEKDGFRSIIGYKNEIIKIYDDKVTIDKIKNIKTCKYLSKSIVTDLWYNNRTFFQNAYNEIINDNSKNEYNTYTANLTILKNKNLLYEELDSKFYAKKHNLIDTDLNMCDDSEEYNALNDFFNAENINYSLCEHTRTLNTIQTIWFNNLNIPIVDLFFLKKDIDDREFFAKYFYSQYFVRKEIPLNYPVFDKILKKYNELKTPISSRVEIIKPKKTERKSGF